MTTRAPDASSPQGGRHDRHDRGDDDVSDEMTRLDEIAARLEAATPGPWEAYGTTVAAMTGPGDCGGCSGLPSPEHEPSCLWSEIAGADEPDAELIAHAPADLSSLLAVVREVAGLHRPVPDGLGDTGTGYGTVSPACGTCGTHDEYAVPWPCPTARALEALTEIEGDER